MIGSTTLGIPRNVTPLCGLSLRLASRRVSKRTKPTPGFFPCQAIGTVSNPLHGLQLPVANLLSSEGVTNGGIIIGALAIYHEDPTGTAARILGQAILNARQHCAQAAHLDGTWAETPDYW